MDGNNIQGITKQKPEVDKAYEQNEAMSLFDVEESKPKRSDTLNKFMRNNGLSDNDILVEDDKTVAFFPKNNRNFNHAFDYNKENDVFDLIRNARYENERSERLHNYYNKLLKDNPGADLHDLLNGERGKYVDGIMNKSKGNMNGPKAIGIAEDRLGTYKDIENFLNFIYNKK